jgi:hypothetical protein
MSPLMEKCEGINQYQFANGCIGIFDIVTEKIVGMIF